MRVGDVYYVHCELLNGPPKKKYLVLVCAEEPLRVVPINTVNAVLALNDVALGSTQVFLQRDRHSFLRYDSWLDCSRLMSGDTLGLNDGLKPAGRLTDAALQGALKAIESSPTIPPRQQRRCVEAIAAEIAPQDPADS